MSFSRNEPYKTSRARDSSALRFEGDSILAFKGADILNIRSFRDAVFNLITNGLESDANRIVQDVVYRTLTFVANDLIVRWPCFLHDVENDAFAVFRFKCFHETWFYRVCVP
jgi:hypothetical protein